ncbi:ira1p [Saccharomyces arboricola H-6]|uniref:Ira1p n=1 Tax=Saccharomyces arboricola (strain H-6 / AS 2.3317 / CBS 10644) TaxID=1160507 RepID=J8Q4Y3_SACAR|nr:ira1p [Saccharomyces arboricola H-6]
MNQSDPKSGNTPMEYSLTKHLFFDRILLILPIESNFKAYADVEADQVFNSCRSIILNIAVTKDLNPIIENTLGLIDLIVQGEEITSDNITDDIAHSVLVLLRLLSDVFEYYWDQNNDFKKIRNDNYKPGFSSHRPNFHTSRPKHAKINSTLATTLLCRISKLKFNTRTLRVLQDMSHHLSGNATISISSIFPGSQEFLQKRNYPAYTDKIDLTIDYIQRFISASNHTDFTKYVKTKVVAPLLISHSLTELGVVNYLDLFGCTYLTDKNLLAYLDILQHLSSYMKRTVFHSLLLYYASKALLFWIMARPKEYVKVYTNLMSSDDDGPSSSSDNGGSNNSDRTSIPQLVSLLFDDIYSTFNVSSLLTNVYNDHHHHIHQSSSSSKTTSTNSPNSVSKTSIKQSSSSVSGNVSPTQFAAGNDVSPTSAMATLNSPLNPHTLGYSLSPIASTLANTTTLPTAAIANTNTDAPTNTNTNNSNNNANLNNIPQHIFSLDDISSFNSSKKSLNLDDTSSSLFWDNSQHSNAPMGNTSAQEVSNNSPSQDAHSSLNYMENIMELYSNYTGSELSSHTSVLRILVVLTLLDNEVYDEMNSNSYKKISEPIMNTNTKDANTSGWGSASKNPSIKHLTHGLKKLTMQQGRKRNVKFLTYLIKNLNGGQFVSDVSLIDSIRSILFLMAMTSSISQIDSNIGSVIFTKRFFNLLGQNLEVGNNWNSATSNAFITHCTERNPITHRRLQLEFFASGLQLDSDLFLRHLQLEKELNHINFSRISLYTEGFRVFFHLVSTKKLHEEIAEKTSSSLKKLFCIIADILLKATPYFDDNVNKIIASILDGHILDQFDAARTLSNDDRASSDVATSIYTEPADIVHNSSDASLVSSLSQSPQSFNSGINIANARSWEIQSILPTLSNRSSASDLSLSNVLTNPSEPQQSNSVNSLSHRLSGVPTSKRYASPNDSERSRQSPYSSPPQLQQNDLSSPLSILSSSASFSLAHSMAATPTILKGTKSPKPNKSRKNSDDKQLKFSSHISVLLSDDDEARKIMMNIFSIFKRMTNWFIRPDANTEFPKTFTDIIKPLFVAILDSNQRLQVTAQAFIEIPLSYIATFEDVDNVLDPRVLNDHYLLCTYAITLFASSLFDLKLENSKREMLLDIIVKFQRVRSYLSNLAEKHNFVQAIITTERLTLPLLVGAVGSGIFISLYCSRGNTPRLLKISCCEFLHSLRFYQKYIGPLDQYSIYNIDFIDAMAQDNFTASGSVAFQRRLRNNILIYIKGSDSILLDSMDVIYKKWVYFSCSKSLSQEELIDFRSLAGILASMSGILSDMQELEKNKNAANNEDNPSFQLQNPAHEIHNELKLELTKKMSYFVSKQCQWLNNPNLLTRENSRDILSIELHPLSFDLLFDNLGVKIDELMSVDLSKSHEDSSFVLLEQIIIIIRTILKRDDDEKIMLLFLTDLLDAVSKLTEIVGKISVRSSKYYKGMIQMSKMFRAFEHSEKNLGISNHFHLKNKWLKLVITWFKLTINKDYDFENLSKPLREMDLQKRDEDFLYIDTSIESAKALAYLTRNVPLEVPPSSSKEDWNRSSTVLFGNHFTILLKGLEKSADLNQFPVSLRHKISMLNENVIIALTNLSNANVNVSLKFTLPMGYSANKDIRIAFLRVFIDIVSNYPINPEKHEMDKAAAMDDLLQYVIKNPILAFYGSLACPPADVDLYASGFLNAFDTRNASHILVTELLKQEIKRAARSDDILRRNSCATRALSIYTRSRGNKYLIKTLAPVLQEIVDNKDSFEIDKMKPESESSEKMLDLFEKYMTKLIDAITNSISDFPIELIDICKTIHDAASVNFPEYAYIAVGSFVFLRFIGPALVSPDSENIIIVTRAHDRKPFITLARVIQTLANGREKFFKRDILAPKEEFLKTCSEKIFNFLSKLCDIPTDTFTVNVREDPTLVNFDYSFLHRFLYFNEFSIRKEIIKEVNLPEEFDFVKVTAMLNDKILGVLGEPQMEIKNEIPPFVVENREKYPSLYEFMSRYAFKKVDSKEVQDNAPSVHESMTLDGIQILIVTFTKCDYSNSVMDALVYKVLQIYARMWCTKHYLIVDCTTFYGGKANFQKLTTLFFSLVPEQVSKNCMGCYYFNLNKTFMDQWALSYTVENPYLVTEIPHSFINSSTDPNLIKSLGLSGKSIEVLKDVRVTLHDITLYNNERKKFCPVSLKIGNKYFQVLHEIPQTYKVSAVERLFSVKFNDVYKISDLVSVDVSNTTGVSSEFTLSLGDEGKLIFCSPKYLEIVKMFYYAQLKMEEEFGTDFSNDISFSSSSSAVNASDCKVKEVGEIVSHLSLVIIVGLFNEDDLVKNISYNLLVATQEAFNLDFGTRLHKSPETYVPDDTITFLALIFKAFSESSPELTPFIWRYMLDGLENNVIPQEHIPTVVCSLSYWVPNLYEHVYLANDEEGPEAISRIIYSLIKLTVKEPNFTTAYLQQIWFLLALDGRLTNIIVEEIVSHALDRDSENRDWMKAVSILTSFPTTEIACQIIEKLINMIKSFLPSLVVEASVHSWSELTILSKISVSIFFESPLLSQMYLPEILFVVALLIDVGPSEIRISLYELLMNVCHSLTNNESLPERNRKNLDIVCATFSRQRLNFISGFSQEKGRVLPNFVASSFSSKFGTLDLFTKNIMLLMEYGSVSESAQWETKFKKYLMDAIFGHRSFFSARAMMILGIMSKSHISLFLCKELLVETMKVFAEPVVDDEQMFIIIAHIFTYSKIVEGLDASSSLMKELFWLATICVESPHPLLFEGGLLFMVNCLKRLYTVHLKLDFNGKTLAKKLMESRKFAGKLLTKLESYDGCIWNEDNFPHIILGFISNGLSIPVVKGAALDCLQALFKNTFYERRSNPQSSDYLCYLFLLHLVLNPEQLSSLLLEIGFEDELVPLDNNTHKVPLTLINWLVSDSEKSNIVLYQGALLFSCIMSDEPCKYRFALLIRYLLKTNPICVFRFYTLARKELRRLSTLEQSSKAVALSFELIGMLVTHSEFNHLEEFNDEMTELLEKRGLSVVRPLDAFNHDNLEKFKRDHHVSIYERKRLATMIIARMSCS